MFPPNGQGREVSPVPSLTDIIVGRIMHVDLRPGSRGELSFPGEASLGG